MADYIEMVEGKIMENVQNDLLSTYEGAMFWKRYIRNRKYMSDLIGKVIGVIGDSDLSVSETIGLMQYMKYEIMRRSSVPQSKAHE